MVAFLVKTICQITKNMAIFFLNKIYLYSAEVNS